MMELECTDVDTSCLGMIGKKYGADRLMFIDGKSDALRVRLVHVKRGKVVKEGSASGGGDIATSATSLMTAAFGAAPTPKPEKATVKLTSSPSGATVFIGTRRVGKTPYTKKLKPGKYKVRIRKKGHVTLKGQIIEVAGADLVKHFELKKVPVNSPYQTPTGPKQKEHHRPQ